MFALLFVFTADDSASPAPDRRPLLEAQFPSPAPSSQQCGCHVLRVTRQPRSPSPHYAPPALHSRGSKHATSSVAAFLQLELQLTSTFEFYLHRVAIDTRSCRHKYHQFVSGSTSTLPLANPHRHVDPQVLPESIDSIRSSLFFDSGFRNPALG